MLNILPSVGQLISSRTRADILMCLALKPVFFHSTTLPLFKQLGSSMTFGHDWEEVIILLMT